MDKATIEAMRAVMGMIEGTVDRAESRGLRYTGVLDGDCSVDTLRTAFEGFRAMVDEAAEQPEKQEKSVDSIGPMGLLRYVANGLDYASDSATRNNEQVRIAGGKVSSAMRPEDASNAAQEIRAMIEAAEQPEVDVADRNADAIAVIAALAYLWEIRNQATRSTNGSGCKTPCVAIDTARFAAAAQTIETLLDAAPAEPAPTTEPTLEECVAAINRAEHRRCGDWTAKASTANCVHSLDENEVRALGAYYIAREKAAEAKGGAE